MKIIIMKNLRTLFYLVLQMFTFIGFSQSRHFDFDHIGSNQGLSQSNVLCIMQDSRGFMWFGTWEGLIKYDGYKITVYQNDLLKPNSISNNYINGISESKNGDLWVATNSGGLCRFDRNKEKFTRYKHDPQNNNSIVSNVVNSVLEDDDGKVWIGTDLGLDRFDPIKNKIEHFPTKNNDPNSTSDYFIKYLFKDSNHDIWIGTVNGGVNLFNRANKTFTHFSHDKNDAKSISGNDIYNIFEDSKKRLWIGTNGNGLELFNKKDSTFQHFLHDENNINSIPNNVVLAINEDADNNLWISTENGGVSLFNFTTGLLTTYKADEIDTESLSNNSVYVIYRDTKNNMWLGNFAGGVDMVNRDKLKFNHYKHMMQSNSLSNNHVMSIMEDRKQNIWIGTDGGGLNLFNPVTGNFKHYRHDKNNKSSIGGDFVLSTCEDSKGNIWIGAWEAGITVFNPAKNTFKHFKNQPGNPGSLINDNAWKIFEDKDKNIWIGTFGGGLELLNPDGISFTHYQYDVKRTDGLSSNNIVNIYEDSDGDLWLCPENGGLNLFNKKTKMFSRFLHDDTRNSISNNSVNAVWEDDNKNLWISTMTGLNRYNKKSDQFKVYTMADGLPGNYIYGVLEDDNKNLWISTNKGVSKFNPRINVFKNYGVTDGLQSNEFKQMAFCKTKSGMFYFGGLNGFNQFSPDSIKNIPFDPELVFTSFQVFNKEVAISTGENDPSPLKQSITETKSITLPYSNAVLTFEFASLNYAVAQKKQYAYMLENFEQDWEEAGMLHSATYTHLDPGKYTFKVKGLDNEGKWSSKILSIQLIIEPPFWLTWWFKLIIFLAVAGSLILFYLYRERNLQLQKVVLQQQVDKQTLQLLKSAKEEQKSRKEAELANYELKIKNRELEQFAYVASHDLQEPLRTTTSFIKLLQQQYYGKFDDRADKYLNFISEASGRMRTLIKDLLDYSRIGKGTMQKIDCNIILKEVLADILVTTRESNAVIETEELSTIFGYPTEIKLLFQNLLINAIKFRKKNIQPRIKISSYKKDGYWEFAVSDNGIGIEKEFNEKIFEIFQRLHSRHEYEGSGIGLSHCKKIVELHHGKIWFDSIFGEGSTFYFAIPIVAMDDQQMLTAQIQNEVV